MNPIEAPLAFFRGFHEKYPINDDEKDLLWTLVACRLAISTTCGALSQQKDPGNAYVKTSKEEMKKKRTRLNGPYQTSSYDTKPQLTNHEPYICLLSFTVNRYLKLHAEPGWKSLETLRGEDPAALTARLVLGGDATAQGGAGGESKGGEGMGDSDSDGSDGGEGMGSGGGGGGGGGGGLAALYGDLAEDDDDDDDFEDDGADKEEDDDVIEDGEEDQEEDEEEDADEADENFDDLVEEGAAPSHADKKPRVQ